MKDKIIYDCSKDADYSFGFPCEQCRKNLPSHRISVSLATLEDEDTEVTAGKTQFLCLECALKTIHDIVALNNVELHLVVDYLGEPNVECLDYIDYKEDGIDG